MILEDISRGVKTREIDEDCLGTLNQWASHV